MCESSAIRDELSADQRLLQRLSDVSSRRVQQLLSMSPCEVYQIYAGAAAEAGEEAWREPWSPFERRVCDRHPGQSRSLKTVKTCS